jgi:hypothetical protein
MTEPEVQLPPAPENELNHDYNPDIQLAESEKHPKRDSTASSIARLGSQDEIISASLPTFDSSIATVAMSELGEIHLTIPLEPTTQIDHHMAFVCSHGTYGIYRRCVLFRKRPNAGGVERL